jgi:hypothetical protein
MKMYSPNNWSWDKEEFNNLKKIEDSSEVSPEEVRGQFLKVCELFNAPEDESWRRFMRLQLQLLDEMRDIEEDIHWTSLQKVRMYALKEVERLLTLDIPLYQRVFEQMDEELSQEVYLGRDGIFAYESRRFQYRARKAAKIPSRRLRPKYLVYSRKYIENIETTSKYFYLRKQGISENSRFFDTGFHGSVPEDILKSLGRDIKDEQMLLLSAHKDERRCRNISQNMREDVVNEIEHRPKMVYTSKGFDKDNNPIEEDAHPISRYIYRVVRLALRYWFYTNPRGELLPLENEPEYTEVPDDGFCKYHCMLCNECINNTHDGMSSIFNIPEYWSIKSDAWNQIITDNPDPFFGENCIQKGEEIILSDEELEEKKKEFYILKVVEAAKHVGLCFKTIQDRMDYLIESTKPFMENLLGDCDGDFKNSSIQYQESEV